MVALSRNRRESQKPVAPLCLADLEVDALRRSVRKGRREIRLSPDEHILLYTLVANAGVVVTHRELAIALGMSKPALRGNTIARHVSTLRGKLGDDADHPHYIETVVGIGYGMRASLTGEPPEMQPLAPRPTTVIAP